MSDQHKPGDPVDPERMAALIDGRLQGAERDALLAQLDLDPATLEVYAEAVAVAGELELEAEDRQVSERAAARKKKAHRWRRLPRYWVAMAAALVAAVAMPLLYQGRSGPAIEHPQSIVARLQPVMPSAIWEESPWSVRRGEEDLLSPRARGARVGARIAQLELAARAGDSAVHRASMQIATLLEGIPGGGAAASRFRSFTSSGPITDDALGDAIRAAEQVAGEREVRAGAWLQAARIAAARRDAGFFATAATRSAIAALSSLPDAPPNSGQNADRLARAIGAADWQATELASTELLKDIAS